MGSKRRQPHVESAKTRASNEGKNEHVEGVKERKSLWTLAIAAFIFEAAAFFAKLSGHWNDPWMKFGLIPAVIVTLGFGVYEILAKVDRVSVLWRWVLSLVTLVLGTLAAIALYGNANDSDQRLNFLVRVQTQLNFIGEARGTMNAISGSGNDTTLRVVDSLCFVYLTNLASDSVTPSQYEIEVFAEENKWKKLTLLPPDCIDLVSGPDPHASMIIHPITHSFFASLAGRKIVHGETLGGWIYVNSHGMSLDVPWRMRIRDERNREETFAVQTPLAVAGLVIQPDDQFFELRTGSAPIDITGFKRSDP